jgi:DNA-binding XRE family transcriptional regulator
MATTKKKVRFVDFQADLGRRLQSPEFRGHYERRRLIHEVALAVRRMREDAGVTQGQLAKAIGTSQPMIARLEKGLDQRTPRWDTLNRIARALGRQLRLTFEERIPGAPDLVWVRPRHARGLRGRTVNAAED